MTRLLLGALALVCVCLSLSPALAADPVTTASLPWGDWLLAVLPAVSNVAVPIAATAITAGIYKVAPWAQLFLSSARIEDMVQRGAAFGQNAVQGVVKGKAITVPLGSAVIAEGVQHILDTAPQRAINKAGGAAGIATRIFRALPLDENSSISAVLTPALRELSARGLLK